MKYIIIVPDGMADWPNDAINGKTPMEAAHTTNMDFMARRGMTGLVKTIPDGMKPGSDIGNLALLGYDPKTCYSGRAPLEAANLGIQLAEDEIAFRCNFVTLEEGKMLDYSAGHIKTEEACQLIESLNKEIGTDSYRFHAGKSYRHLLILKSHLARDLVKLKTVPPHDIMGQAVQKYLPDGKNAALVIKIIEQAAAVLEGHQVNKVRIDLKENPANSIWLWGQGGQPVVPSFKEKYGLEGGIISAVDLVNGIGRLAGLEVITVPGATGYYDTNFAGKAEYGLECLKEKDFVYIHIEAPDEAGHNGDLKNKIASIENIDREIVGRVLNHFDEHDDFRVLVLPDHPTPVAKRTHTDEPVPFVLYGKNIAQDGTEEFGETSAAQKGLRFHSGEELIQYFVGENL